MKITVMCLIFFNSSDMKSFPVSLLNKEGMLLLLMISAGTLALWLRLNFLHQKGSASSFHFQKHDNVCWIPTGHILCCIEPPTLAIIRGLYQVLSKTSKKIIAEWQAF